MAKKTRYYCAATQNYQCTKEGCFLNGGPCCCTINKRNALVTIDKTDKHNYKMVPAVANDKVADAIAELSETIPAAEMRRLWKRYGVEGIYMNARVISERNFITTVAGPGAYEAYYRGSTTLEEYAAEHHIRYTDASKLSRLAINAHDIYTKYCRLPLQAGITGILIHYYGAKMDAPHHLNARVIGVFERNFYTLDQLLNASEDDIMGLTNIGKSTLPYALKLQETIREVVKKGNYV